VAILPVAVKIPVEGSYNSALSRIEYLVPKPPQIRTLPSGSRTALCTNRGVDIVPVTVNVPLTGSYSSALSRIVLPPAKVACVCPPAIRTLPSGSRVALCPDLDIVISPVAANEPEAWDLEGAALMAAANNNIARLLRVLGLGRGAMCSVFKADFLT